MWSMATSNLSVWVVSSYQDHHWPVSAVMVHRPVTSGNLVASCRRTSFLVLQPSRSSSIQCRNCSRE
jgi:hypothetical protein